MGSLFLCSTNGKENDVHLVTVSWIAVPLFCSWLGPFCQCGNFVRCGFLLQPRGLFCEDILVLTVFAFVFWWLFFHILTRRHEVGRGGGRAPSEKPEGLETKMAVLTRSYVMRAFKRVWFWSAEGNKYCNGETFWEPTSFP